MDELHKDNLYIFLSDNIFVEYFNSFLLLPTFSCHLFYDLQLGVFQPVHDHIASNTYWTPNDHGLLPSCSSTTLYLTNSSLGQFSDPALCQDWIINNRLSLFLKSDLYSEYKLLKLLSNSSAELFTKCIQQFKDKDSIHSSSARPRSQRRKRSAARTTSSTTKTTSRRLSASSRSYTAGNKTNDIMNYNNIETKIIMLKSKSGLEAFKKFLIGRKGEINLLFWISVESLKHDNELSSSLKEILYRYGSQVDQLEDIFSQNTSKNQQMKRIVEIGQRSLNSLTQYWYPRFLISSLTESRLPYQLQSEAQLLSEGELSTSTCSSMKSHTPTFRKMSKTKSTHQLYTSQWSTINTISMSQLDDNHNDRSRVESRMLWSRDSIRNQETAMERSSKLATYNKYPLIPCGRTSSMSITDQSSVIISRPITPVRPPTCPQILSVCGTPTPLNQYQQIRADYKGLLNCLSLEKRKAGGYFQKHLELLPDKMQVNLLLFWREVQEYKGLFLKLSFSITAVEMKAKVINGKYIVEDSPQSICCPSVISMDVLIRMWPAFEDLFDCVEEYSLSLLLVQWKELCTMEYQSFENLQQHTAQQINSFSFAELEKLSEECDEGSRCTITNSDSYSTIDSQLLTRPSSSLHNISTMIQDTANNSSRALIRDEEILVKKEMTFSDILKNSRELEYFKTYLNDNNGAIHLMCWMEIESYRGLPAGERVVRNMKAKQIRDKYFTKQYFFGSSSPVTVELQRQVVSIGGSQRLPRRPKSAVFREAQKHIRLKIEKFTRLFVRTTEFLERTGQLLITKERTQQDNTSINLQGEYTESDETILLRKALGNREERRLFQYFINSQSPEGTCPGRQVDYWLEVQRYKSMFHSQMNTKLLQDKMNAILQCYYQSQTPPRVQINIPNDIAQETIHKPFGPYVFRESQAIVFRHLQNFWMEYQNLLEKHNKNCIEETIRKMKLEIAKERTKMKQENEQIKKEEEINKVTMPRFETLEEKNIRLKQEQELKEFGEVSLSFRLSHINPQFTYYDNNNNTSNRGIEIDKVNDTKKRTVHYQTPLVLPRLETIIT